MQAAQPLVDERQQAALDELGESVGGSPERRFETVTHIRPMLSLDKCYDDDTLKKWQSKIKGGFMVTPKMDGLACSIRHKADGSLEVCATRGNGKTGDDITANASQIKDIPTKLKKTKVVTKLGEFKLEMERCLLQKEELEEEISLVIQEKEIKLKRLKKKKEFQSFRKTSMQR